MDTSQDKSGARQFSLRKLMLWIAVCAVYLDVVRLTGIGLAPATLVTVWLAMGLVGRLVWGLRGAFAAIYCVPFIPIFLLLWKGVTAPFVFSFLVIFSGLIPLLIVHLVVLFVDWIDTIGRKSRPPDS